jgi:predicted dehydrogenase
MASVPIRFGLIGGGWRAEFFTRIAEALPERFQIVGVHMRDAAKAAAFGRRWSIPVCDTLDAMADLEPAFVVLSVKAEAHLEFSKRLHALNLAVLCETPAATDVPTMIEIWRLVEQGLRIQVAEQYLFQPHHAARLAIIGSGRLGAVSFARVSAAHGYHGVSLMRQFLGIGFEDAAIRGRQFVSPVVQGGSRDGSPTAETIVSGTQLLGEFDFGGKLGLFDFTDIQYWSYVRSHRVTIRGERGEIADDEVRYLRDFRTPVIETLRRRDRGQGGDLDGHWLESIQLGGETMFSNPFWRARLMDDEIAIATALEKMAAYARGWDAGPYSFAEAAQDQYLSLLLLEAARTGETIRASRQPWAAS